MTHAPLKDRIVRTPCVYDARAAEIAFEHLKEDGGEAATALCVLSREQKTKALLRGVFSGSPFLTGIALRRPASAMQCLERAPEYNMKDICVRLTEDMAGAVDEGDAMRLLRHARCDAALTIGLADIAGAWSLWEVTRWLTDFADVCVEAAVRFAARMAAARGDLDEQKAQGDLCTGLVILGMGKYGAHELNYSSDIDLIALFDPEALPVALGAEPSVVAVRMIKALVKLLQDVSEDGYVFRVDLRLRPDGGASPVALSIEAAELYYESAGQNWERAAMIKARPVAADVEAGEAFLSHLVPFVWRKHLDFAAIADIHAIKRQIHAYKGHAAIAVAGHNLKLGRGGIREIEFFAQTQQLIMGGRDPGLRARRTDEALEHLAQTGLIDDEVKTELLSSYEALRTAEHRLQMIDDQQTHTLPEDEEQLCAFSAFCGFESVGTFKDHIRFHLERVQAHYAKLFETEESLASEMGSLVFTGVEDDPETLRTLSGLGFEEPAKVSSAVRRWHYGHIRATRSEKSRELLTRLTPALLKALGEADDPDRTFREFARFLEGLPTGVQIFSLLASNPWLLKELADLFCLAPHMASVLSEAPGTLDGLIDTEFRASRPLLEDLRENLAIALSRYSNLESKLDAARIFARENRLRVAVQLLAAEITALEAGEAFSLTAQAAVEGLYGLATQEMAVRHGHVPQAEWAVVAMGKLGGRELTATSDLDLIFVYDHPGDNPMSDGVRPLAASQYFARTGQKLISLLTVPTSEGVLYEVDMRLRPSGRAGPIAVSMERFVSYHTEHAWTWEHMALTRARVIAGSIGLSRRIQAQIAEILTRRRNLEDLQADVQDMRRRLLDSKATADPWLLKHVRGGLIDLEFIAQTLQLAAAHYEPAILAQHTREAFEKLGRSGVMEDADTAELVEAIRLVHGISHLLRICLGKEMTPASAPRALKQRLMQLADSETFETLEDKLGSVERAVQSLYEKYVDGLTHLPFFSRGRA